MIPELDPLANHSAVYVEAADVDVLHAEWLALGLRVVTGAADEAVERAGRIAETVEMKPWGNREFTVFDPDNNQLRFGHESR